MNLRLTLMFLAGLSSLLMTNAALSARSSATLSPSSSLMSTPTSAESVMDVFELPCTKTYVDGRTRRVASCGGESTQEVCCDIDSYKNDASSCVLSCSCTYSEHREGTREVVEAEYPVLIRGVPILSQFDARSRSGYQPIGCGPIAVTQLALYYDAWGWTDVTCSYLNSDGKAKWKKMARDAADTLGTWVRNNASPTFINRMKPGIEDIFADFGYSARVDHDVVKNRGSEEADAYEKIKTSILQGRPVVLGFDVNADAGGGIGGGGDNLGFIDHYGLIVGFDDTGSTPRIDVNMGWSAVTGTFDGGTSIDVGITSYNWEVGTGKVHLWFVQLDASEKTLLSDGSVDELCTTPNPHLYMTPSSVLDSDGDDSHIGSTYEFDTTTPVMHDLIQGSDCELLGGEVTRQEDYDYVATWTDTISCSQRYAIYDDVLSGEWDPETPEEPGTLDRLGPL